MLLSDLVHPLDFLLSLQHNFEHVACFLGFTNLDVAWVARTLKASYNNNKKPWIKAATTGPLSEGECHFKYQGT